VIARRCLDACFERNARRRDRICRGGGPHMAAEGLKSPFRSTSSRSSIRRRSAALPSILRRIRETAHAVVAARPDCSSSSTAPISPIGSPPREGFARPSHRRLCVSLVWAWRSGRARACGPTSTTCLPSCRSSLPLISDWAACLHLCRASIGGAGRDLRPNASRRGAGLSIRRSCWCCQAAVRGDQAADRPVRRRDRTCLGATRINDLVLPTVPRLLDQVTAAISGWRARPKILDRSGENTLPSASPEPRSRIRHGDARARACGVPMVAGLPGCSLEAAIARRLIKVPSAILATSCSARASCRSFSRRTACRSAR